MSTNKLWQERIGNQRDWVWRGWQTRYSYTRSKINSDTPLILLHGFGASIEHWRNNIPILGQQYHVYALDLLGFGASRKANTKYSVYLWVEQVHDFWQTFIGEPVVLVGNSIGSLVCLTAAITYPEMVKGIVMLSLPDVSIRQEMIPAWLQPIVSTIENLVASPILLKNLLKILRKPTIIKRWAGVPYPDKTAITDELVTILSSPAYDRGSDKTFLALFRSLRQANFAPSAKEVLPQLKIPILLIWGDRDRMVPPKTAPIFAALNPQIKYIEMKGVGHCPHDECPDRFNQILLDWLKESY